MVAKRSARTERTQTVNQARALIPTGPDDLRARFAQHTAAGLVAGIALLRPRPGDAAGSATRARAGPRAGLPGHPDRPAPTLPTGLGRWTAAVDLASRDKPRAVDQVPALCRYVASPRRL